jgi:hypothetical protein
MVMKKYPVLPELIVWEKEENDFAPAAAGPVIVASVASPASSVASVE